MYLRETYQSNLKKLGVFYWRKSLNVYMEIPIQLNQKGDKRH